MTPSLSSRHESEPAVVTAGSANAETPTMWNDTDIPLALLITFRCRGTWLHGDERGSVDRYNNTYGTPRIPPIKAWKKLNAELLAIKPVTLDAQRRSVINKSIIARARFADGVYARSTFVLTTSTAFQKFLFIFTSATPIIKIKRTLGGSVYVGK